MWKWGRRMVDPNVLRAVGYDPEEVTGFAFGLGVERVCAGDMAWPIFANSIATMCVFCTNCDKKRAAFAIVWDYSISGMLPMIDAEEGFLRFKRIAACF